jgi:hypothetical protein
LALADLRDGRSNDSVHACTFPFGYLHVRRYLPLLGTPAIAPEWSWGLFCAAGGVFGSWVASKTQIYMPEHFLGFMLGAVTGVMGCLYVLGAVVSLPFRL